jgi:hypothetical protein
MNLLHDNFRISAEAQKDFGFSPLAFERGKGRDKSHRTRSKLKLNEKHNSRLEFIPVIYIII